MRRREKVQAKHPFRMLRPGGDLVGIEVTRIGRKHRIRAQHPIEPAEEVDLDVQIVEHGLDDEIAGGQILIPRRHRKPDRKSVVEGKSVSVRVDLGGSRIIKKKNKKYNHKQKIHKKKTIER